jgi:hypothetical protein
MLGNMWDYTGKYENRIKTGKSVSILNPTINIIGGNTPTGFALAFPPEILGQGFFSRLLLIHSDSSGKKFAFPDPPSEEDQADISRYLQQVRTKAIGKAEVTPEAKALLTDIYNSPPDLCDIRFESYYNRRFTHLLKLCLIHTAARLSNTITEADVVYAHTVLTFAEHQMPKALGEFGKSKHSDIAHKIIQFVEGAEVVVSFKEIWKSVSGDLEKQSDLATILQNLVAADKLQPVPDLGGYIPKKVRTLPANSASINYSLLTPEERKVIS